MDNTLPTSASTRHAAGDLGGVGCVRESDKTATSPVEAGGENSVLRRHDGEDVPGISAVLLDGGDATVGAVDDPLDENLSRPPGIVTAERRMRNKGLVEDSTVELWRALSLLSPPASSGFFALTFKSLTNCCLSAADFGGEAGLSHASFLGDRSVRGDFGVACGDIGFNLRRGTSAGCFDSAVLSEGETLLARLVAAVAVHGFGGREA